MALQRDLFDPVPISLVRDEEGGVRYLPACVDPRISDRWFRLLLDNPHWGSARRMMYDREVDVPRLMAGYTFDGVAALPEPVADAFAEVCSVAGAPFNSVGLNLYRDEQDSVAPHGDKVERLLAGQPIAILSLGATRRMSIRSKAEHRRVMHLDLEAGSILVMSYESQLTHEHGIPKLARPCGPRISLAFRCFGD